MNQKKWFFLTSAKNLAQEDEDDLLLWRFVPVRRKVFFSDLLGKYAFRVWILYGIQFVNYMILFFTFLVFLDNELSKLYQPVFGAS